MDKISDGKHINFGEITIKGARVHNLKSINVSLPRNRFIVITGVSGSGKSSLAFDTLYAEGQRRYVESLSAYARQFLGKLEKPDVDSIVGISPAVAIEQKVISRNSRSTVGTTTEILDYLKLLFTRIGKTISPISGKEVKRDTVTDVVNAINVFEDGSKIAIYAPIVDYMGRSWKEQLKVLALQGYSRIKVGNKMLRIDQGIKSEGYGKEKTMVVIDRLIVDKKNEENNARLADSAQLAFYEGHGTCIVEKVNAGEENTIRSFSDKFEADSIVFEEPSVQFFTYNSPVGACKTCEGFGSVIGIDADLVIPNRSRSVYEGAVACWNGDKMRYYLDLLVHSAAKFDFPVHRAIEDLNETEYQLLWEGNEFFTGLNEFFKIIEKESYKIQYRVMLSRYRGKTICPDCNGTRLRKDAGYVKVGGMSIQELMLLPIDKLLVFFEGLELSDFDFSVAGRILDEIKKRLGFLLNVGLGYLTLNRNSNTLSGGESQRINLATSLGSSLVGSMYILDEPSIGLHSRDTQRLIKVLRNLRDLGNTVIVVEHDEEIIREAEYLVDLGPLAGSLGGEIVFAGNSDKIKNISTLTSDYLNGTRSIPIPNHRRKWTNFIEVLGAAENNLKNLNVKFPLNTLTVVCGVSGSGKSTLVKDILFPALKKMHGGYGKKTGKYTKLKGQINEVHNIELIDQHPIGKSSRSNPVTYVKAYDDIRALFASQNKARLFGMKPSHFSFNVSGGRCDECEGEGQVKIEMQFMADVYLTCDTCHGKRFKDEVLEIKYRGKNIYDILNLTLDEAMEFFEGDIQNKFCKKIVAKLKPLQDVGMGYVKLGLASSKLSGGEAQRIKLGFFLIKGRTSPKSLFIFDEPTTGLHFHDVKKLLLAFDALVEHGHSVIVIEHNLEVIKSADWLIELGPEGGEKGGEIIFEGTPEELLIIENSPTAPFLKKVMI